MKINVETVKAVAQLAKLQFDEEELGSLVGQFAEIVNFVEKLSEVDTSKLQNFNDSNSIDSKTQDDQVIPGLPKKDALANAPQDDGEFFIVPKVIADE